MNKEKEENLASWTELYVSKRYTNKESGEKGMFGSILRVSSGKSTYFTVKWIRKRWISSHRLLRDNNTPNMLPDMASRILALKITNHNLIHMVSPNFFLLNHKTPRAAGNSTKSSIKHLCHRLTCIIDSVSSELPQIHRTLTSGWKESSSSPLAFALLMSELTCPFDGESPSPDACILLWKHNGGKKILKLCTREKLQ